MLQQVMTEPGKIEFQEVPVPKIGAGQALVKIMEIGVCGSDIHVYHGEHPFTSYPVTQGHEVSGVIEKLGDGVEGLKVGQKVTIQPQVVCGECWPCRNGKYNLCESLNAMIEPLAVAVHAVRRAGDVTGKDICVLGAGPIGILVAQAAKGLGAGRVMVTDVSRLRLEKAKECGADMVVNTRERDFGEAFVEFFGPDKADVIYDCAGNDVTMGQAIKYARKGSTIILVAVFAKMASVDLAVLNDHELDLNTSMMYRSEDYEKAIELVQEGKVRLMPLLSKRFPFREYLEAYKYIDENRESTMKVLIDVQK